MAVAVEDDGWNRKGGHRKEKGVVSGTEKPMATEDAGENQSPRVREGELDEEYGERDKRKEKKGERQGRKKQVLY